MIAACLLINFFCIARSTAPRRRRADGVRRQGGGRRDGGRHGGVHHQHGRAQRDDAHGHGREPVQGGGDHPLAACDASLAAVAGTLTAPVQLLGGTGGLGGLGGLITLITQILSGLLGEILNIIPLPFSLV